MWVLSPMLPAEQLLCESGISDAFVFPLSACSSSYPALWLWDCKSSLEYRVIPHIKRTLQDLPLSPSPASTPTSCLRSYCLASKTICTSIYVPSTCRVLCFYVYYTPPGKLSSIPYLSFKLQLRNHFKLEVISMCYHDAFYYLHQAHLC